MRRMFFAALAIVIVVAITDGPFSTALAQTAPPPPLTGETLLSLAPEVTGRCNPDGTSTISFSAFGEAVGPYPGTFSEVGTATIGPQEPAEVATLGPLLAFDAVFTIESEVGRVTGTKTLMFQVGDPVIAQGTCNTIENVEFLDATHLNAVRYEAIIVTADGAFADSGFIPLGAVQQQRVLADPSSVTSIFVEQFASDNNETTPVALQGHATGGGQLRPEVTFGFNAKSDNKGVKGKCTVIDREADTTVKCLEATTYFQSGNLAMFSGPAIVNGMPATYRITVDDNGEPGDSDTFTITTEFYGASGVITHGNIQVRD
jgi:hypothetical protein